MKHLINVRIALFLLVGFFNVQLVFAQFENKKMPAKTEKIKFNMPGFNDGIEQQVIEIVKPVKDKIEELLNADGTGTFESYKKAVANLNAMSNGESKSKTIKQIYDKYYPFFKNIWSLANINESDYQTKLKNLFPPEVRETIQFTEFLNFTSTKKSNKPEPPPAPPPTPGKKCIDAMTESFVAKDMSVGAISPKVRVGNNDLAVSSTALVAGFNYAIAAFVSDIKIPGTFPSDNTNLRITKSYRWGAEAFAISILGCSYASIGTSTDNFSADYISIRTWAPVIFISMVSKNEIRTIQTEINKRFIANIRLGITVSSACFAEVIAGSTSFSYCGEIMWSTCEQ